MNIAIRAPAISRHAVRVLLAVLVGGCGASRPPAPVSAVDFIKDFDRAEQRPASGFSIGHHLTADTTHAAILAIVPSRLTWSIPIPRHGTFRAWVASAGAAPVRVRIGVSDSRVSEELAAAVTAGNGWSTITADLSAYAGWKISLFYRPDAQTWRVNLSADAIGGIPGRVAWGEPEIVTTTADALEYARRRLRITRSGGP
jgi:hypothetical protein